MVKSKKPKTYSLYRIFYSGERIVYLGRTSQPVKTRLRNHFIQHPDQRKIDVTNVAKVEYAELPTEADMFVYEVYFINLYKPPFNRDDLSFSDLSVRLPDLGWQEFDFEQLSAWQSEVEKRDKKLRDAFAARHEAFEAWIEGKQVLPRDKVDELRAKYEESDRKCKW